MSNDNGCFNNLIWFFSWLWITPKYKKTILTQQDIKETQAENVYQIPITKYMNRNDIINNKLSKVKDCINLCDKKIEVEEKEVLNLREKAKRFRKQENFKEARKALTESKLFEKKIEVLEKQKNTLNQLYQKYDLTSFTVSMFKEQQDMVKTMGSLNTKKIIDDAEKLQEDVSDLDVELKQILNLSNFKTDEVDEQDLDNELNNLIHEREEVKIDMSDIVIPKENVKDKIKENEEELIKFEKELIT
jgi:hypothetical protein